MCEQWTDQNVRTWQPCPTCVNTILREAQAEYRAETGGDGTLVQESLKNLLTSRDLRGHDEWACRLGHEKGRMTSVALRKRTRSNSPCPTVRTPRQMFADPSVVETVVKPEGIGAKWVFPVLLDNQWVWMANMDLDRQETCCCRRRSNSLRCACGKRAANTPPVRGRGAFLCPRCQRAPVTDMYDEWCQRCERQAEKVLKQVETHTDPAAVRYQDPLAMLFTGEQRAMAEHARKRLKLIAEHEEWFVDQKARWASESRQRRNEYIQDGRLRPPPAELPPTAVGQVISEGAEAFVDIGRGPPPPPLHFQLQRLPFGTTRSPAEVASGRSLDPKG